MHIFHDKPISCIPKISPPAWGRTSSSLHESTKKSSAEVGFFCKDLGPSVHTFLAKGHSQMMWVTDSASEMQNASPATRPLQRFCLVGRALLQARQMKYLTLLVILNFQTLLHQELGHEQWTQSGCMLTSPRTQRAVGILLGIWKRCNAGLFLTITAHNLHISTLGGTNCGSSSRI